MKHIFFVEDDLSLINGLSFAIKKQGYELTIARTSVEAEQLWAKGNYDLIILDVTLPDGSGFDLCQKIRESSKVPIMFLTAADEETDIIMGLDIGGDDYMTKPFKLAVFLSRINALLRRSENFNQEQAEPELQSNGIRVQLLKQEVTKNGVPLDLTASEYKLLCLFMENPNIVLSPEQILRQHRTIAEASAVESPIRRETIGFPAHFFARAHNFKPPGRACQPEADSPMRT